MKPIQAHLIEYPGLIWKVRIHKMNLACIKVTPLKPNDFIIKSLPRITDLALRSFVHYHISSEFVDRLEAEQHVSNVNN